MIRDLFEMVAGCRHPDSHDKQMVCQISLLGEFADEAVRSSGGNLPAIAIDIAVNRLASPGDIPYEHDTARRLVDDFVGSRSRAMQATIGEFEKCLESL